MERPSYSEVENAKRKYANPRGLPEKWIENYLQRDPSQLALDVMRVYDGHWSLERSLRRTKLVLGTFSAFLTVVAGVLALLKFL